MRNVWVIAEKEYKHFFISPVAYAVAFAILLILGILFYVSISTLTMPGRPMSAPGVELILAPLTTLLLFTTPGITMRALAEEQKNGTLELLLTAPVRDWEVVVGKWLGAMLFILTLLAVTWFYPIVLNQIIQPGIDQGMLVSGYLGVILMSGAILAIGVMTSSFFSNQIAAFFATLGILLLLWMISYPSQVLGNTGGEIFRYLDMAEHFYPTFLRGIIELKDIVYYLSVIALALFLGSVSVETRRWR
jgi:ABC-2 type transport system permease protein